MKNIIDEINGVVTRQVTYQYQLGDKYKLCIAKDKKEAMLVFGVKDVNRVNRYIVKDAGLVGDLFREHDQEYSSYDGRMILVFNYK